jgi:hypothetical protein
MKKKKTEDGKSVDSNQRTEGFRVPVRTSIIDEKN